jgi:hypothetical protein
MTQNEAVMESTGVLPPGLLYPILKALGPKTLLKGEPRPVRREKVDPAARQAFADLVKAAARAKSAAQFAELTGATAIEEDVGKFGPIVGLEVFPRGDAVFIRIKYENGVTYDHYYPAGTFN